MEGGKEVKWIKHYSSSHEILLVGEGDFSFSNCLAKTFGCAKHMVATSLDDEVLLGLCYSNANRNIDELKCLGCNVMHNIDATTMAQDSTLSQRTFHRIVFNFPYASVKKRGSRSAQLSKHKNLVKLFFENAKKLLAVNGEIHVTHKTNSFHIEWDLHGLASLSSLRLIDVVGFKKTDYPGYENKYGWYGWYGRSMNASFECQPSITYKFVHA
ncbi:hypothetical protein MKX03_028832 [Papaver bracteatum]|nr:hypothetical protein MKX03_028832 [Papaver bracteatum]